MTMDLATTIKTATELAQQATTEDKNQNYAVASQSYMAAAQWFLHATKYGTMSEATKINIRTTVDSYLKRVEELKKVTGQQSPKKQAVASDRTNHRENSKGGRDNDEENADSDRRRRMQKFEGAIVSNPQVSFNDVVGLKHAKSALQEAVILPIKYPRLFTGKRRPWAGILLYGPPGTGKSYLAKAIATECKSTFISISSSDILNKWVGEAEQSVKSLFELARERKPCIVFIDEIDALCGQRNDSGSEASKRVVTEFLVQMDGVGTNNSGTETDNTGVETNSPGVLVLAATNIPWQLDTGIRRRLEKRIYIPLPGVNERAAMFKTHLGINTYHTINDHEWMELAEKAEHYSGADIAVVCREALLRPVRRLVEATHFKQVPNPTKNPDEPTNVWLVCSPGDPHAQSMTLDKIEPDDLCNPPVTMSDMLAALNTQRPTVGGDELAKYQKFTEEYGQQGS
ncbi:unnamed protein product [Adineta steineri]|uniref:Vesicle-fusing ATPase n=1 Tax=Adineta steineri TaxID=433720 RepID=A0A813XN99_9BILA|nr:unnamed protein product [Adineta steineri]CAF3768447.1 unnamed protein product [Adineta steineri]